MSGNKRPPNELESRLHQAALSTPGQVTFLLFLLALGPGYLFLILMVFLGN